MKQNKAGKRNKEYKKQMKRTKRNSNTKPWHEKLELTENENKKEIDPAHDSKK